MLLWETIFPDLLDVITLGVLPLAPRLLLQARWKAVAFSVATVLLCVAGLGTLLLPAVAENAYLIRHLVAYGTSTCSTGLSALASLLAVQSLLKIILGTLRSKRVMPVLQTGVLFALFLLRGYTPRLLETLQQGTAE